MRISIRALALLAAAGLGATSPAAAASYHLIGWRQVGVMALDGDSVRPFEGHVAAWLAFALYENNGPTAFMLFRDEIDCGRDRVLHLSVGSYDERGVPVSGEDAPGAPSWSDIAPGTPQADEERLACDPKALAADEVILDGTALELLYAARHAPIDRR